MNKGTKVRVNTGEFEGATGVVMKENALLGADSVLFSSTVNVDGKGFCGGYFRPSQLSALPKVGGCVPLAK